MMWIPWVLLLLFSGSLHAIDGRLLYEENCAVCHGIKGDGGVGIPLSNQSFLQQAPDEYLRRTIRYGRPGRIMPAFPDLTKIEVTAIIRWIRQWSDDTKHTWDDTPIKANAVQGEAVFEQHCSTCHGVQASGGAGTGLRFSRTRDFPVTAPALANPGFLASASDVMLRDIILQGRIGTPMPSAAQQGISANDVDDVVAYLRSLQQPLVALVDDGEPAILSYESPYDFATTLENLQRAAVGMNFKLIRTQAVNAGFVSRDKESTRQQVVYFCNFNFLYEALELDPRIGVFLPCRITVVEHEGVVQMMSVNPKRLSRLFNNVQLDQACDEMTELYITIMEEASL